MIRISEQLLEKIRKDYSQGTRVEIITLNDKFLKINPGEQGTVLFVDDLGTIHIRWDCGMSCGIVYGEDICGVIEEEKKREMNRDYYCRCIDAMLEVFVCSYEKGNRFKRYVELLCA